MFNQAYQFQFQKLILIKSQNNCISYGLFSLKHRIVSRLSMYWVKIGSFVSAPIEIQSYIFIYLYFYLFIRFVKTRELQGHECHYHRAIKIM